MDLLLTDLDFDLDTRHTVIRQARDTSAAELHADASFHHQLGTKFRPERAGLVALLDAPPETDTPLASGLEILRRRSERPAPVMTELKACARAGRLTVPLPKLAVSYLHMHANGLLRSAHRAQELVLYDFLSRLYESRVARAPRANHPRHDRAARPKGGDRQSRLRTARRSARSHINLTHLERPCLALSRSWSRSPRRRCGWKGPSRRGTAFSGRRERSHR
jgi:hypothetical protein